MIDPYVTYLLLEFNVTVFSEEMADLLRNHIWNLLRSDSRFQVCFPSCTVEPISPQKGWKSLLPCISLFFGLFACQQYKFEITML